jgi:gamma-glutamyl phosphate reductase
MKVTMSRRPKLRAGSARTVVESSAAREKTQTACPQKFLNEVDSATVYWNASKRFTDLAWKLASAPTSFTRGPMALEELTIYKYVIRGEGQIRE